MTSSPNFRLHLLGPPQLLDGGGEIVRMAHRHRMALLVVLAMSPGYVLRRDKILALLWPEQDSTSARNLLNVAVHGLRRVLGAEALRSVADELTLSSGLLTVDAWEFREAVATGNATRAAELYRAPFVDGFHLARASELSHWVDANRSALAEEFCRLLDRAADEATARGDHVGAVTWLRRRSQEDPYNTRAVVRHVLAMERAGQAGAAVQVARAHESLLQQDLEVQPDPTFVDLVERLRTQPNGHAPVPVPSVTVTERETPIARSRTHAGTHLRRHRTWIVVGGLLVVVAATIAARTPSTGLWMLPVVGFPDTAAVSELPAEVAHAALGALRTAMPQLEVTNVTSPNAGWMWRARRRLSGGSGLTAVLATTVRVRKDSLIMEGRLSDPVTGGVERTLRVAMSRGRDNGAATRAVAERIAGAIALQLDSRLASLASPAHSPPNLTSLTHFRHGLDGFVRAEYRAAAASFGEAWRSDTAFALARTWEMFSRYHGADFGGAHALADTLAAATLIEADEFGVAWLRSRMVGDVPAALRAAREAAKRMPRSQWAFAEAEEALALRRPREAIAILSGPGGTAAWIGGWSKVTTVLSAAYHLVGDFDNEQRTADAGLQPGTNLYVAAINRVPHLAARGDVRSLERMVESALATPDQPGMNPGSIMQRAGNELDAHGFTDAAAGFYRRAVAWYDAQLRNAPESVSYRWALGRMLRAVDERDSARRVMKVLDTRRAGYVLQADLGLLAAESGDRATALRYDSLLATPGHGINVFDASQRILHRGSIHAELGDGARALELLQQAMALGAPTALDSVHVPRSYRRLRGWPPFDHLTRVVRTTGAGA